MSSNFVERAFFTISAENTVGYLSSCLRNAAGETRTPMLLPAADFASCHGFRHPRVACNASRSLKAGLSLHRKRVADKGYLVYNKLVSNTYLLYIPWMVPCKIPSEHLSTACC